jgi:hypothetical protein
MTRSGRSDLLEHILNASLISILMSMVRGVRTRHFLRRNKKVGARQSTHTHTHGRWSSQDSATQTTGRVSESRVTQTCEASSSSFSFGARSVTVNGRSVYASAAGEGVIPSLASASVAEISASASAKATAKSAAAKAKAVPKTEAVPEAKPVPKPKAKGRGRPTSREVVCPLCNATWILDDDDREFHITEADWERFGCTHCASRDDESSDYDYDTQGFSSPSRTTDLLMKNPPTLKARLPALWWRNVGTNGKTQLNNFVVLCLAASLLLQLQL